MEHRIEERGELNLVGRELRVFADEASKKIPQFWDKCAKEGMFQVFDDLTGRVGKTVLGWSGDFDPKSRLFSYICAVEVSHIAEIPVGMVSRSLPAARYFVATAKGEMPKAIQTVIREKEGAIKEAGYERSAGYEFELYGEDYDESDPDCEVTIWAPVK